MFNRIQEMGVGKKWAIVALTVIGIVAVTSLMVMQSPAQYKTVPEHVQQSLTESVHQLRVVFDDPNDPERDTVQNGSCVAIEPAGRFLTAAHVVTHLGADGALQIKQMRIAVDGRPFPARLVAVNPELDLALIETVESGRPYEGQTVPLSASNTANGQAVFAFGFPADASGTDLLADVTISSGYVSDLNYEYEGVDDPILRIIGNSSPGASGGAIVDEQGKLLGIVVAARFIKGRHNSTHIMAVPRTIIQSWLESLPTTSPEGKRPDQVIAENRTNADLDGDGLIGDADAQPWIAQIPDVAILPADGVAFQLQTDKQSLLQRTTLSAVQTSSANRSSRSSSIQTKLESQTQFRLGLNPMAMLRSARNKAQLSSSYTHSFHFEESPQRNL